MRIDKVVQRISKSRIITELDLYGHEAADFDEKFGTKHNEREDAFRQWFSTMWNRFITDPDLEMIAAKYGIAPEEVFEGLDVRVWGGAPTTAAGYSANLHQIEFKIPLKDILEDRTPKWLQIMFHEFDHAATAAGGLPAEATRGKTPLEWARSPSEQSAMKSEILDLLNQGYTKQETWMLMTGKNYRRFKGDARREYLALVRWLIDKVIEEEDLQFARSVS